jgi:TPR repeat protein
MKSIMPSFPLSQTTPCIALCLALMSPFANASFETGFAAYQNKDYVTALREWKPLAIQGNIQAQVALGLMYLTNPSGPNYVEAAPWFRLAANQGSPEAQYALGVMYNEGSVGFPKDVKAAAHWHLLAANQGHAQAQYSIGLMYETGAGVSRNEKEAIRWYQLAANQGSVNAQHNLDAIRVRAMKSEQLAYGKYQILYQGPEHDGSPATYVITTNPRMAIFVNSMGAEAVKQISTGSLKKCQRLPYDQIDVLKQGALKMYAPVSQVQMDIQLGASLDPQKRQEFEADKNLIKWVNAADDAPYFSCDITSNAQ